MADEEPDYLRRIRGIACHVCESPLMVEPHHHTYGTVRPWEDEPVGLRSARGKGQRAHDSWAIPLCVKHHRQFHDAAGHFAGWTNEQRRAWQDQAVAEYRGAFVDVGVF